MRRPSLRSLPSLCSLPFTLLLLLFLSASFPLPALSRSVSSASTRASPSSPPLLVLSTVDGGVLGFDAATGRRVFSLKPTATGPAVSSWAAPGQPRYIPGLNGMLYRLGGAGPPVEVDGVFLGPGREGFAGAGGVGGAAAGGGLAGSVGDGDGGGGGGGSGSGGGGGGGEVVQITGSAADAAGSGNAGVSVPAVVLKHTHTSVTYVDAKSGKVVREIDFETPGATSSVAAGGGAAGTAAASAAGVIVLSRTSVSVRVLDAVSNAELANASLTHTTPSVIDGNVCMPAAVLDGGGSAGGAAAAPARAFTSLVDVERGVVTMVSESGSVLWTTAVESDIIEAHGLGDVAVERAATVGEIGLGEEDDGNDEGDSGDDMSGENQNGSGGAERAEQEFAGGAMRVRGTGRTRYALAAPPQEPKVSSPGRRARSRALARFFWMGVGDGSADYGEDDVDVAADLASAGQRAIARMMSTDGGNLGPEVVNVVFMLMGLCVALGVALALVALAIMRRLRVRRREKEEAAAAAAAAADGNGSAGTNASGSASGDARYQPPSPARRSPRGNYPHLSADILAFDADASNGSATSSGAGNSVVPVRGEGGWMVIGSFEVSSKVLGFGSHGTIVYEGRMVPGGRRIAVKRLLRQLYESARQEISLLVELDEASPHVVRYFAMEEDPEFIYLALELCQGSLSERVQGHLVPAPPRSYTTGPLPRVTCRALRQLMQGLVDLHQQGIVHRDLKPQNVLCQGANLKLADVGLALRLDADRSSFTAVPNAAGGVGTTGWRAPEVLNGERQTRSVDIFAAGCIISYVVTNGDHPFGSEVFGRDRNISKDEPDLRSLSALQSPEAYDIVKRMLSRNPKDRPSAAKALQHPFFWTDATKLAFLVDISDRLYDLRNDSMRYTERLDESNLAVERCSDWPRQMDPELLREVGAGYISSASNLLRIVRNKRNHYSELSPRLQKLLGPLPDDDEKQQLLPDGVGGGGSGGSGDIKQPEQRVLDEHNFLTYFLRRVPQLLMCVYAHALNYPVLVHQPHFTRYGFECAEVDHDVLRVHPRVANLRSGHSDGGTGNDVPVGLRYRPSDMTPVGTEISETALTFKASVARPGPRRYYGRGQLVAMGESGLPMPPEAIANAKEEDVYGPEAGERWRRCLTTGIYDNPSTSYDSDGADSDTGMSASASVLSSPAQGTPTGMASHTPSFELAGVPFLLTPTAAKPPPAPPPGFEGGGFGIGVGSGPRRRSAGGGGFGSAPGGGGGGFGSAPGGGGGGFGTAPGGGGGVGGFGPGASGGAGGRGSSGFGRDVRGHGHIGSLSPPQQPAQHSSHVPQGQFERKPKLGFTAPGEEERRNWADLRRSGK